MVTADPEKLSACNKVIITASTLLNNSIDEILDYAGGAERKVVIGPTAGFFPDPLFSRGVAAIGGSEILSATTAQQRLSENKGLGDSARKFLISKPDYPGLERIIHNL